MESVEAQAQRLDPDVERRVQGLIGLGVRARTVVVGVEQVRLAARRGRMILAFVAPDASRHSRDKVLPLLAARRVRVIEGLTAASLGAAVGKEMAAAVGITDSSLAAGVRRLVDPGAAAGRNSGSRRTR
ncbi:MAG: L7Ae/L30e/S12e/Gadd45 family ribosomal protein [Gemmatimonadaceae bacterium]